MSCENVKCYFVYRLSDYLEKTDILFWNPKHKINILTKFACSKLRWDLTIYHFPETWMVQNLDNKANRYIRKWLNIPISGNVNPFRLKVKQLDISLKFPSDIYRLNQYSYHIETSQLICRANQLAVFRVKGTLVVKRLKSSKHSKRQYREKISKCKDCQVKSWQWNSLRNNDINKQLKRTKYLQYLHVITSTKSFKNCNKKLESDDQHS